MCELGTFGHTDTLTKSVAQSKTIHTLLLPISAFSRYILPFLCRPKSLKLVQIKSELRQFHMPYKAEVDADPKLGRLIKYTAKS
jgi:hypothetical protein